MLNEKMLLAEWYEDSNFYNEYSFKEYLASRLYECLNVPHKIIIETIEWGKSHGLSVDEIIAQCEEENQIW